MALWSVARFFLGPRNWAGIRNGNAIVYREGAGKGGPPRRQNLKGRSDRQCLAERAQHAAPLQGKTSKGADLKEDAAMTQGRAGYRENAPARKPAFQEIPTE